MTESETKVLIEDGLTVGEDPKRYVEAVDHAKAYDYMFTLLGNKEIAEKDILYLHKLFYHNIGEEFAGEIRDIPMYLLQAQLPSY